jgi:polysaccharide biosynthesis protein PslG
MLSHRRFVHSLHVLLVAAILAGLLPSPALNAQESAEPEVLEAVGVNIHAVNPQALDLKTLAASGVRWVRMDFDWSSIERARGEYDFRAYDALLSALDAVHIRAIFTLDYRNPLYDQGLSPASDEARQAFARWAAAAAVHFRGRGLLWEIYNEPNARFWTPQRNTDDYIKLALATGEAVEDSAPGERLIGPASAVIDLPFLEACFRAGLLNYWSAVSIHPYRMTDPETVADDLRDVRLLIRKYAPPGKTIPIIVSEWGYSALWNNMDDQKQAERLAREWLVDIANDVRLTIWYDWRDGADPHDPEQHFGLVSPPAGPVKPAYRAAQNLSRFLNGFRFNKRLSLNQPDDYLLLFTKGTDARLVAWTTGAPHTVTIPASAGRFDATGLEGEALAPLRAGRGSLKLQLNTAPQYLAPEQTNPLLEVAAAWDRLPLEIAVQTPGDLPLHFHVKNPLAAPLKLSVKATDFPAEAGPAVTARSGTEATLELLTRAVTRSLKPVTARVELEAHGLGRLSQATWIVSLNPLRLTILPATENSIPVAIANPSGDPFRGSIRMTDTRGLNFASPGVSLDLAPRSNGVTAQLPLARPPNTDYTLGLEMMDDNGNVVLDLPPARFIRLNVLSRTAAGVEAAGYKVVSASADGSGEGSLAAALPAEGAPWPGMSALELAYRLPGATSSVRLAPEDAAHEEIPDKPRALGLWLYGNASGVRPYVRFADSTGQVFEEGGSPVNWRGWRYVLIYIDLPRGSHQGGANDGVMHYPIHWHSLLVIQNGSKEETHGSLYLSSATLIY